MTSDSAPRVARFVTCLADLFRPSIGFAALELLQDAGCDVRVPSARTCCGQPAWTSGDRRRAAKIARQAIEAFPGLELREMTEEEIRLGCGGALSATYPDLSSKTVSDKAGHVVDTGAELRLAGDLGCLTNRAGKPSCEGRLVKTRHVVEVLAGMTDGPAIGEAPAR